MGRNLFVPSFGAYPHLLVGRDTLLDEFEDAFDGVGDAVGLTVLLSGQRGMGKTVLLDSYKKAAEAAGWVVVTESSSNGLLERLTRDHLPRLLAQHSSKPSKRLTAADGRVGPVGGGAGWEERYPAESTLRSQITELTDQLVTGGQGLVLTVDEVQAADVEELRKLGEIVQYARREGRPFAFAAAGLATPIEELLDHPGTTFLRRAEHHVIGPVQRPDVRGAFARTVADSNRRIDAMALDAAADAIAGYPFMIQLAGYYSIKHAADSDVITPEHVATAVDAAQRRLGRLVHAAALRPLSDIDRTYLLAMAQDENPSRTAEIAQRMGVTPQYANVYRARLIKDGIIESAGRGHVRFTIPYLSEYLREHAAHDALEDMGEEPA